MNWECEARCPGVRTLGNAACLPRETAIRKIRDQEVEEEKPGCACNLTRTSMLLSLLQQCSTNMPIAIKSGPSPREESVIVMVGNKRIQ